MEICGIASHRGVSTVKPSGVDAMFPVASQREPTCSFFYRHTELHEIQNIRVASLLVESLLRNLLSISPDHASLALRSSQCDLAADDVPALSFAVLAKPPFLKLPLVLAFTVAVLAT